MFDLALERGKEKGKKEKREKKEKGKKRKKGKKEKREKLHVCQCRLCNRRIHPEPVFAVCQLTLLLCCLEI